jgi:hypothetical protein
MNEAAFNQHIKELEKELSSETQAFNRHEDVSNILARNKVFIYFTEKLCNPTCD